MKNYFTMLLFLTILVSVNLQGESNIDMQINKIKNAPPSERVKLMNAFKQRVSQMNAQERSMAIKQIRIKMRTQDTRKGQNRRVHISNLKNRDNISGYQKISQQQIKNLISRKKMRLRDVAQRLKSR